MNGNHVDLCEHLSDETCPACCEGGIIQKADCDLCGGARWIHRCGGRVYNPVTGASHAAA